MGLNAAVLWSKCVLREFITLYCVCSTRYGTHYVKYNLSSEQCGASVAHTRMSSCVPPLEPPFLV